MFEKNLGAFKSSEKLEDRNYFLSNFVQTTIQPVSMFHLQRLKDNPRLLNS